MSQENAAIARTRTLTNFLNGIGAIACICAFFFPRPYAVVILVCALTPIASIAVMALFKGTVAFDTKMRKSGAPYLTFALALPPMALAWRALTDFHILTFDNVWVPTAAVSVIFAALLLFFSGDIRRKPASILITLVLGFAYGYGILTEANCLPDTSTPRIYTARVLGKRITYSSKSHSYYIRVTPWGPRTAEHEISIKKGGFDRIKVNDEITMNLREGFLGIPWFIMEIKNIP